MGYGYPRVIGFLCPTSREQPIEKWGYFHSITAMIDWVNLVENTLWVLGCALALATLSYASWQASWNHEKFSYRLGQKNIRIPTNIAFLLFCIGLAATSRRWWEIGLWIILAILFFGQIVLVIKNKQ